MLESSVKSFNLPWHQHEHYWLYIHPQKGSLPPELAGLLKKAGLDPIEGRTGMGAQTLQKWKPLWDSIYAALKQSGALNDVFADIAPGTQCPAVAALDKKSPAWIQELSESLWLGNALVDGRVMCYLQPVMSGSDKVFGYESFVRVRSEDGGIIAGDRIVAASKVLGIQYMIDRHLHVQAIKTFVSSDFNGFLFINFFPGFIQRPEVYLEGLNDTVKTHGITPAHIVLDFTRMETPRDLEHIKNVCAYGRAQGYSVALDDIVSLESAQRLVPQIHPDFLKIDMHLVHKITEPGVQDTIRAIVELVHSAGGTVIGEGIETEESFAALKALNVDLFQGYFFSPPVPVEKALGRKRMSS